MARKRKVNGKARNGGDLGFEQKLFALADKLRGQMDPAEYKHVVLGLIFLKYISDAFQEHYKKLEADPNADPEERSRYTAEKIFWVPQKARWSYLQDNTSKRTIGKLIDSAMVAIEKENPDLKSILPRDYGRASLDQHRLQEIFKLIETIGLGDEENRSKDILGRVYEYFLGQFASTEGKGGEFYTPRSVVKLLVKMIEPYKGIVYDPCCGSGGMFVQSEKFVQAHGGTTDDLSIYGQESNLTTWRLCKMNLAIRGIRGNIGSQHADTFHKDSHKDIKADFILANPPFNDSDWGGERLREDVRWQYGTPPAGNANFAWVQHIIHHLALEGVAGFVLSNGSLSATHGQSESKIRQLLINSDLIDCIVALPGQLFYTTQIAACLWFIANSKTDYRFRERCGQTLFIYAHHLGQMVDRTHCELSDNDITLIADTYHRWREKNSCYNDIPGFCKSATLDEIKDHKMSLVPGRYVGCDEKLVAQWDISRLSAEFSKVETRLMEINKASDSSLAVLRELLNG